MKLRIWFAVSAAALVSACGSAPVVAPKVAPIGPDLKMSWILRLEDQRILKAPVPPVVIAPPVPANQKKKKGAPEPPPPPVVVPDLTALASDADSRIRRRAALAIGRVGLADGAAALQPLLTDADADVRQMA